MIFQTLAYFIVIYSSYYTRPIVNPVKPMPVEMSKGEQPLLVPGSCLEIPEKVFNDTIWIDLSCMLFATISYKTSTLNLESIVVCNMYGTMPIENPHDHGSRNLSKADNPLSAQASRYRYLKSYFTIKLYISSWFMLFPTVIWRTSTLYRCLVIIWNTYGTGTIVDPLNPMPLPMSKDGQHLVSPDSCLGIPKKLFYNQNKHFSLLLVISKGDLTNIHSWICFCVISKWCATKLIVDFLNPMLLPLSKGGQPFFSPGSCLEIPSKQVYIVFFVLYII